MIRSVLDFINISEIFIFSITISLHLPNSLLTADMNVKTSLYKISTRKKIFHFEMFEIVFDICLHLMCCKHILYSYQGSDNFESFAVQT